MAYLREYTIDYDMPDSSGEVEVTYTMTPYDPGVTFGPPECCYPPEGGDVEIVAVTRNDTGAEVEWSAFEKAIVEHIERYHEHDEPDYGPDD